MKRKATIQKQAMRWDWGNLGKTVDMKLCIVYVETKVT